MSPGPRATRRWTLGRSAAAADAGPAPRGVAPSVRWIVLLALVIYLLPLVRALPLVDPDEGLHAAIAREMAERRDWLVPRLLGVPFLDKPFLFSLMQAVTIEVLGPTELAVRLPGQLFGLLGAVTTGLVAGTLAGGQAALAAGCVYATLAFPLALNQAAVHDIALVPFTNLAVVCFLLALRRAGDPRLVVTSCAVAGVWLGLALLTKGLSGVALVGLPIAALVLLTRRLSWRLVAGGLLSLIVAASIALPWYLAMERAHPGYLHYFFLERHVLGFTTTTQLHGERPWWYYVPVVLAGSAPWVVTAGAAWSRSQVCLAGVAALRRVGVVWLMVDLVFLSLGGSKLATYVLPVLPAVVLVVTCAWLGDPAGNQEHPTRRFSRLIATQALAGAAILPLMCAWTLWVFGADIGITAWVLAGIVGVGWLDVVRGAPVRPLSRSFAGSLAGMAAVLALAYVSVLPALASLHTAKDLADYFNRRHSFPPRLWIVDERVGSLLFYLEPSLRTSLSPDRVDGVTRSEALLQGPGVPGTVIALPADTVLRLSQRADIDDVPFETAGRYRLYDAAVLRNARPRLN